MEIDFMGLSSPSFNVEKENRTNLYNDAGGGVEISLSLCTSSPLNLPEKKKTKKKKWEFGGCHKMISPSCSGSTVCSLSPYNQENSYTSEQPTQPLLAAPPVFRRSAATGFICDLNESASATPNLRNKNNMPQLPYVSGNNNNNAASTPGRHTPTVAMARRATLARFLEKRLHRMNQARASSSHLLMGNSLSGTSSEACETTNIARNNKKRTTNGLKNR